MGTRLRLNLFHTTGDLILRTEWDNFQLRTKVWWDKNKIPYQSPQSRRRAKGVPGDLDGRHHRGALRAGRRRRSRAPRVQTVAAVFEKLGGKIVIGRATPSKISNGRLEEIALDTGQTLRADTFVFAVGPWLGKTFPELFAKKTRVPIGYVCYFGTPIERPSIHVSRICRASTFPASLVGGAAGGQSRLPRARRRARADATWRAAARWCAEAARRTQRARASCAGRSSRARQHAADAARERAQVAASNGRGGAACGRWRRWWRRQQTRTSRRRSRIRTRAIAGPTRRASKGRAASSRTASRCSRTRRSRRRTPATTSRRRAATSSSTPSADVERLIAAGGNAEGFKFGPKIGEYIAQRVLGDDGDPAIAKAFKIPENDFEPTPPPAPADTSARGRGRGTAPRLQPLGRIISFTPIRVTLMRVRIPVLTIAVMVLPRLAAAQQLPSPRPSATMRARREKISLLPPS